MQMLWKKASNRSSAPVAADIEMASHSREDDALRLNLFDRHCINDTGAFFPTFKLGSVKPSNQPCWDFSLPLVSKAESAINNSRRRLSGMAWIRSTTGNVFKCRTTLLAAWMCSIVGSGKELAKIDAAADASGRPSRETQFSEAMRPLSCVFSVSDSFTEAASFFSTFRCKVIGSSLV